MSMVAPLLHATRRFAIVGTGDRASMFLDPLASRFRDHNTIVGLCDLNPTRLAYHQKRLVDEFAYPTVPTYRAEDFDRMIAETRPHTVIVCTVDAMHEPYIVRSLDKGCDVIVEKPIATTAEQCRAILQATARTGREVRVTFNYRWAPGPTKVREVLSQGVIGRIVNVNLEYFLNTSHGADYFRRWHRVKDRSGGLMVHKATHHFDLVNWWMDAVPREVFGYGQLAFYGRQNAEARGVRVTGDRYTGHPDAADDPFAMTLDRNEKLRELYLNAEHHDGYRRDQNVFGDGIDIEDAMSVLVKYRTGAVLNYALHAFLPREGMRVVINGTGGRLEYQESQGSHIPGETMSREFDTEMHWQQRLTVQPLFEAPRTVEIPASDGGHGGADPVFQEQMFGSDPPADPWGRHAMAGQGVASALVGIAANQSLVRGRPISLAELCPELGHVDHLHALP